MFERLKFWKSSEQKEEIDVTESVKDSELRSCLNNLAREEENVLRDAPKGAKAYRDILQSVLKIQLALKEYEEQVRIPLSIAKDAVTLASPEQKTDTLLKIGNMKHFTELEKMARKVGAKASYKRASSTLERLEQWGFLKRRPVKHMKEKFFWVMNPEFLQKYQHQLIQIFGS